MLVNYYGDPRRLRHLSPPRLKTYASHAQFTPVSPSNLTKKHAYKMDADSGVLSYQLGDQGGVPHQGILETEQHVLLAHQLQVNEKK